VDLVEGYAAVEAGLFLVAEVSEAVPLGGALIVGCEIVVLIICIAGGEPIGSFLPAC
jgi:hypothetical protein